MQRLVTQNLLASAAQAVSGTPNRASVEDLASVINTVALYEGLVVLGDPGIWKEYARQSPFINALCQAQLLKVTELDDKTVRLVAQKSRAHLASATKQKDLRAVENLLEKAHLERLCHSTIGLHPDGPRDIEAGREWITTTPDGQDFDKLLKSEMKGYSRGAYLYVRTFFYVAYMDVAKLDFTADRIRSSILAEMSHRQQTFQKDLIDKVSLPFSEGLLIKDLAGWFSPFAALVFRKAKGNRDRIPEEMMALRDRLTKSRKQLIELQSTFRYGQKPTTATTLALSGQTQNSSYAEGQKAYRAYQEARNELVASFSPAGHEVSSKGLLAFGTNALGVAYDPVDKQKWLKAIGSLPIDDFKRFFSGRRFVEIHRLRDDLPASAEMLQDVEDLFGQYALAE